MLRRVVTSRQGCLTSLGLRSFATSPEILAELGKCSTQSVVDALWVMGYPQNMIEGARPLAKGMKCVGNAVTVRFVHHRPDIQADKPMGEASPEYVAFELCGPNEILVMSSVGPWESVGGDIKFLRLAQRNVGGLVTDGSVRDTDELIEYGFPVFSHSTTAKQGPAVMQPWACNDVITCGNVSVRPGDAIVGDQDGVVVVPEKLVEEVIRVAEEREEVEVIIKDELRKNPGPPGKYYPFKPPIKVGGPLYKLLEEKKPSVLPRMTFSTMTSQRASSRPYSTMNSSLAGSRRSSGIGGLPPRRHKHAMRDPKYMQSPESYERVLSLFAQHKACAVLRTPTAEAAPKAMNACVDGGFKLVEFTLTTPGCLDTLADFRAAKGDDILTGCGTVMDIPDAMAALDAGSEFLVAPVMVPEVVTWCALHNVVIIPGCQTPTEAYAAYKAGAPVQKIFPGVANGHMWIKAVSAALPMLKLNPTSGVDLDNAGDFLKNGANSIGLVAPLFPPDVIANEDWDTIQANAVKVIGNVKAAMA